jgi:hypothetical protein
MAGTKIGTKRRKKRQEIAPVSGARIGSYPRIADISTGI